MPTSFENYSLADGQIRSLLVENATLRIAFQNWQEREDVLVFEDFLGLEGLNPVGEDMSHGTEVSGDPLVERICRRCEEPPGDYRCFSFFPASSRDDQPVLKIVARSFSVVRA